MGEEGGTVGVSIVTPCLDEARTIERCVARAKELKIRELMAISASDKFLMDCGFGYSLPNQKRALFVQTFDESHEQE